MDSVSIPVPETSWLAMRRRSRYWMCMGWEVWGGLLLAGLATGTSLAIAIYANWSSTDRLPEQLMRAALVSVCVLSVHLLPVRFHCLAGRPRFAAVAVWLIALLPVLYGQISFFLMTQSHAADARARLVVAVRPLVESRDHGARSRVDIAKDIMSVDVALPKFSQDRCYIGCDSMKVRRERLIAKRSFLLVELDEAKRRESREDAHDAQLSHTESQRAAARSDPVASVVASWVGTTERRVEFLVGLMLAVVLEATAIVGWTVVAQDVRGRPRLTLVSQSETVKRDGATDGDVAGDKGYESPRRGTESEDESRLGLIHSAVKDGLIEPTQSKIRAYLGCGQRRAGELNRMYHERFGAKKSERE
ncbi:hypothetical protein PAN31117_04643 [Pandoraea anapnoica]|uniref:Uncharacterized protein n=1 Tax=Pandoraea anapnoica TaxID=2508301 RepID=A0A5E5AK57_9BURK|nr:hypothetical protein PIN31009_04199 [Pandoraea iniqua]VVE73182.1 hypothetical protein PAN31117_04643 [Pandoraea anapnoica]